MKLNLLQANECAYLEDFMDHKSNEVPVPVKKPPYYHHKALYNHPKF